jgi:hypothetical protein
VYWISSHGRNKDGERKSKRERLFATEIKAGDGGRLDIRGLHKPYETLLTDLADAPPSPSTSFTTPRGSSPRPRAA